MNTYLFPFAKVKRGSKVVLYGAGRVGLSYLEQIVVSGFCEVCAIADRNAANLDLGQWNDLLCLPEDIQQVDYDSLVLCIKNETICVQVMRSLSLIGVPAEKIIVDVPFKLNEIPVKKKFSKIEQDLIQIHPESIPIAVQLTGGLGDFLVSLKVLETFLDIAPQCVFHIFCDVAKLSYAKCFYDEFDHCVTGIYASVWYNQYCSEYAAAITITHFIEVDYLNQEKMNLAHGERLSDKIAQIQKEQKEYCSNPGEHYYQFFGRCKFWGLNRYTALGHRGIFSIQDQKVRIHLDKNYQTVYASLNLRQYITTNFAVDCIQVKMWPKAYFEELFCEIKEKYPNIEIVQLGPENAEKINGLDRYVLGESLELTKYILQHSLLHIDIEGGLVHLATQLGTKCAVIAGPTPIWYYGYEQNINIVSTECKECDGVIWDWDQKCVRGLTQPTCMYSIKPRMVITPIAAFLNQVVES